MVAEVRSCIADGSVPQTNNIFKPRSVAFSALAMLAIKYVYHEKCVPHSYLETVMYGDKLSQLPVCRAMDQLTGVLWNQQTWAALAQWAQSLL